MIPLPFSTPKISLAHSMPDGQAIHKYGDTVRPVIFNIACFMFVRDGQVCIEPATNYRLHREDLPDGVYYSLEALA